jgi:polyhydroxyalkanoate synthesis regulator phasin
LLSFGHPTRWEADVAITDTLRRYVEAGRDALSPKKAEDLARGLARQGEIRRDQVAGLAGDLMEWSRRNRDRLLELIRREVRKQIARAGVATKDEVDALKRRIRELEREARTAAASATRKPRSTAAKSGTTRKGQSRTRKSTSGKKTTAARRTPT